MIVELMPFESLFNGSDPSSSQPTATSILSRFSSPLSKRSRNIFDFSIEPDDPSKLYKPGEIVSGNIVLNVLKGFDITHLVVALHGYAKVFKHQQDKLPSYSQLVNGKGSKGFEYHGDGLASLFQDEQTLCGSGFLRKQLYKFGFELQFPKKSLPSALDFERGTIAYMISATVTRPITISPTTTRTISIRFRDSIDIESMYTTKTRMITLEPISRRGKMKRVKTNSSTLAQDQPSREVLGRQNTSASIGSTSDPATTKPPLSPAPSEDTVGTNATVSSGSFQVLENDGTPPRKISPQNSDARSGNTSSSAQTITAITELPRYGALPGDLVPIKVSITHTKSDVRGVIIATLYRQGRIDMLPILPLAGKGKDKKQEYEDVYPKSRTGLGGLYFSTGSPSSVYRKDLSQSSTMMIINPQTLTAEIKTSIKVPDDVFPTISNVPGGMISFTYHIEVVIDLVGKLGESRFLPSLTSSGPSFSAGTDNNGNQLTSDWANSILDTAPLRRTKSVVTFELPLVVGTTDTRRIQLRQLQSQPTLKTEKNVLQSINNNGNPVWHDGYYAPETSSHGNYTEHGNYDGYWYDEYGNPLYDEFGNPLYDDWYDYDQPPNTFENPPTFIPQPEVDTEVDEKTRLRRQAELLLPSQPPDSGESSHNAQDHLPSAPQLSDSLETPVLGASDAGPSRLPSRFCASARSTDTIVPPSSAPPPSLPDGHYIAPTEDKQELERQRLMAQASAPPDDDVEPSSSHGPSAPPATAPVIDEDEEYITRALHHEHSRDDHLPQYHR